MFPSSINDFFLFYSLNFHFKCGRCITSKAKVELSKVLLFFLSIHLQNRKNVFTNSTDICIELPLKTILWSVCMWWMNRPYIYIWLSWLISLSMREPEYLQDFLFLIDGSQHLKLCESWMSSCTQIWTQRKNSPYGAGEFLLPPFYWSSFAFSCA